MAGNGRIHTGVTKNQRDYLSRLKKHMQDEVIPAKVLSESNTNGVRYQILAPGLAAGSTFPWQQIRSPRQHKAQD